MNTFKIELLHKEKGICRAGYFNVLAKASTTKAQILFTNCQISQDFLLNKGEEITMQIFYNEGDIYFDEFELAEDTLFSTKARELILLINLYSTRIFQNLPTINLMKAWDQGSIINWRSLDKQGKKAWLGACLLHSGISKDFRREVAYHIDCSIVKTKEDFYCLLAEVFFGDRGYFGRGIEAFEDCLLEMKIKEPHNSTIVFSYADKLARVVDKNFPGYMDEIIRIFKVHKFNVILE